MEEQDIGLDIEVLGGKEAYDKAEYIAKGVAKEEQLKYMRKRMRKNPNSTKVNSLLKALTYLDEFNATK